MNKQSVLLELNNIRKEYPGVIALNDLSLSFKEGEVHAICGENGAGKSTLIKTITGAIQPTAGEIIYCGSKMEHQNPIDSMKAGIACIYQEFNLIPQLSVAENIFFGREIIRSGLVDYKAMYGKTETLLEELGVCIDPKMLVKDLTVGFQQIVEIAKALSQEVKVLIMDEPSAPLTNNELEYLFRIVKKLKKQNVTIIYISHRLEEVFELADRVSVIRDGQYISTMEIQDTTRDQLIHLMVGRELGSDFPEGNALIGDTLLKVTDLNTKLLQNISFDVKKGEILGLAGLVGAGRSETARAIFGADPIKSGRLELKGREITVRSPGHAISQGIGLIPEDRKQHGILAMLSIRENISYSSLNHFVKRFFINAKQERREVESLKQKLRIKTPSLEVPVSALSGGNQQKVVLSKTLMANSDILFFDEPTRGIDVGAKQEIYKLMNDLAAQGKAIVMISSEMPELIGMSDRILVLCEGEIVKELQPEEFSQEIILNMPQEEKMTDTVMKLSKIDMKKNLSKYAIPLALALLVIIFSLTTDAFMTSRNIINILRQVSIVGICAVGMTFVILTGGIDLSVGSVIGVAVVSCAKLMVLGIHPVAACIFALLIGGVVGVVNGLFINEIGIPPLITTLALMTGLRGIAYKITACLPVYGFPQSFAFIGQGYVGEFPYRS